ncbi:MAG: CCA tRNA nucleotidyltransferase [Armatimonadetes bacterium]|nr:CCA tRNA nucleotidyltransferase [Armatimonadota bacterium]
MKLVLDGRLLPHIMALLRAIGEMAAERGMRAYLVGGPVRDALLGRGAVDLDVVVEGDACALAALVARRIGGRVVLHEEFRTAVVELPTGGHLDLATARRETYQRPGALPLVEPANIEDDLRRRDFTVNALAVSLDPDNAGELLDPTGGYRDLRRGTLRAILPRCFVDDATRVVRAAVYIERLALKMDGETGQLLKKAVDDGMLETVTPQRHGEQLWRGLLSPASGRILLRLAQWGVLASLGLPAQPQWPEALRDVDWARRRLDAPAQDVAAAAFALAAGRQGVEASRRLGLGRELSRTCEELAEAHDAGILSRVARASSAAEVERWLGRLGAPTHVALWALAPQWAREKMEQWHAARRNAVKITGRDLLAAGIPEGPAVGVGLRAAMEAALEGRAGDAESQLAAAVSAARRWLAQRSEGKTACGGKGGA